MKDIIGFIVPDEATKSKVEYLMKNRKEDNIIIVETLRHFDILEQAEDLVKRDANIIIARGGTYNFLEHHLNIPVVNLKINNTDILQALNKGKNLSNNIYLVLEDSIYFDYDKWKPLINVAFEIVRFRHYEDIKSSVEKIHNMDEDAVIIGGIITTDEAQKLNHKTVFIENQEENIIESYQQALDILNGIKENKKKMNLLLSIIHNIEDAVIVLNNELNIEYFNEKSLELLDLKELSLHQNIAKLIPQLYKVIEINKNVGKKNIVHKLLHKTININIVPLVVDGGNMGIVLTMKDIGELQKLEKKIRYQLNKKGLVARYHFKDIITCEDTMVEIIDKAKNIAKSDSTVLIYGESGTGKEMIAQSIHNYSSRKNAPFVAVNCAALSESLLESELFGYVEGAFTGARKEGKQGLFELAHGGTIFLDEINSISFKIQSKLLRVIEEKEIMRLGSDYIIPLDIRIISASNEELLNEVKQNNFRGDLFFRLNVLEIRLLPLRDREKDIVLLFEHFVKQLTNKEFTVNHELKTKLLNHEWHGNIRELTNTVERYVIYGLNNHYDDLFSYKNENTNIIDFSNEAHINMKELSNRIEKTLIESLEKNGFNRNQISDILGISRTALWKKTNKR